MSPRSRTQSKIDSDDPPAKILGLYTGQWVAIYHRQVVAAGPDGGVVLDEARAKLGGKEPTMMHVPAKSHYPLYPL
jgi:hypothetical protein